LAIKPVLPKRTMATPKLGVAPMGDSSASSEAGQRVVGVDLGFVQTKAVWGTREVDRCKFGSLTKRRSEVATEGVEDSEGYTVTVHDNAEDNTVVWNVGAKGVYDFTAERLTRDSDLPKLLTVLGLINQQTAHSFIDLLVSGLPVDDFNAYRAQFGSSLEGTFQFGFGNRSVSVNAKKALIIPQSAGAYYDYGLTQHGEVGDSALLGEDVLVFDVGGRTSDGCIMENSKYSQDSFTIYQGVWKVQNELRRLVAKAHRYTMHPSEVDSVMRSGKIKLGGSMLDVSALKIKAIETIFPSVRDEVSLHVSDFRRFSAILLAGGGAYLYRDYIEELAKVPVIVLPEAEFSNASGYRKYGLLMSGA
jgi:hypothetical protein